MSWDRKKKSISFFIFLLFLFLWRKVITNKSAHFSLFLSFHGILVLTSPSRDKSQLPARLWVLLKYDFPVGGSHIGTGFHVFLNELAVGSNGIYAGYHAHAERTNYPRTHTTFPRFIYRQRVWVIDRGHGFLMTETRKRTWLFRSIITHDYRYSEWLFKSKIM